MRTLVCGGRDFRDAEWLHDVLYPRKITCIIQGGARGADMHAAIFAQRYRIELLTFPANWGKHGKGAGPIRNRQMLVEGKPDITVAFPGGNGTADMVRQSRSAGVPVLDLRDWELL